MTASETRQRKTGKQQGVAPLYLQVARTLKAEIVNGVYPVGSKLPTEDGLCQRFSVSRHTVREALRLLREDGLVSSRKRAGTTVLPPHSSSGDIHKVMSIDDLLAFGSDTRLHIETMETVTIDAKLAAHTGLPRGREWLTVRGPRCPEGSDTPLCWSEYYVNREFAAVGRLLQRHSGPIFPLIEDLYGVSITDVRQQISATLISPALVAALDVKEGSAALQVRRTYISSEGAIVQVTINTHPAARYQHSMTMHRMKA